jgi:hypothetical protein
VVGASVAALLAGRFLPGPAGAIVANLAWSVLAPTKVQAAEAVRDEQAAATRAADLARRDAEDRANLLELQRREALDRAYRAEQAHAVIATPDVTYTGSAAPPPPPTYITSAATPPPPATDPIQTIDQRLDYIRDLVDSVEPYRESVKHLTDAQFGSMVAGLATAFEKRRTTAQPATKPEPQS